VNKYIEALKSNVRMVMGHRLNGRELDLIDNYLDIAFVRGQQNGLDEAREILDVRPIDSRPN
jgi:hypothetical protein